MIWVYGIFMVASGVAYIYTQDWIFFPLTMLGCAGVWWEWKRSRRIEGDNGMIKVQLTEEFLDWLHDQMGFHDRRDTVSFAEQFISHLYQSGGLQEVGDGKED